MLLPSSLLKQTSNFYGVILFILMCVYELLYQCLAIVSTRTVASYPISQSSIVQDLDAIVNIKLALEHIVYTACIHACIYEYEKIFILCDIERKHGFRCKALDLTAEL